MKSIVNINYVPILKTKDAELRSFVNLDSETMSFICPLFELTKSRKISEATLKKRPELEKESGSIKKRIEVIKPFLNDKMFILDITSQDSLINNEIKELQKSENSYQNWINYIKSSIIDFPQLIPVLQVEDIGQEYEIYKKEIEYQCENLLKIASSFAYRASITEINIFSDLDIIAQKLSDKEKDNFLLIIDAEYIENENIDPYFYRLHEILSYCVCAGFKNYVFCASSFPKSLLSICDKGDESVLIAMREWEIYRKAINDFPSLKYGDYASINPEITEGGGGRWHPHIDISFGNRIISFREDVPSTKDYSGSINYRNLYASLARKAFLDQNFKSICTCWGKKQIQDAAELDSASGSPSFWISVRSNIHMTGVVNLLKFNAI